MPRIAGMSILPFLKYACSCEACLLTDVMIGSITDIKDPSDFEEVILKHKRPVLVYFWAAWCPHCEELDPILQEVSKEYEEEVVFYKVDVDSSGDLPEVWGVLSIPALSFFYQGIEVQTVTGSLDKATLKGAIASFLKRIKSGAVKASLIEKDKMYI